MGGFDVNKCTVKTLSQTLFVVLVTCHVLHALNPTAVKKSVAVASEDSLSTMGLKKVVDVHDDVVAVVSKTADRHKTKIRGSVVESTTSTSNNNINMFSDPIFKKSDSIGSSSSRELQTCNICEYTIFGSDLCRTGYMIDSTYGDGSTYGAGDFKYSYSSSDSCYDNACCTTLELQPNCCKPSCSTSCSLQYLVTSCGSGYEKTDGMWATYLLTTGCETSCCSDFSTCCTLASAPVTVPIPASIPAPKPAPIPAPLPTPVLVPVPAPVQPRQINPIIYVAIGIIVPIIIGVVVAIICIANRNNANEKKNTPVDTAADHTTVEQTRSAETTAQTTSIKITTVTPPPPVMDVPASIPTMQPDDISMFTEDRYSVWNQPNPKKAINVPDTYSSYGPVVDGSVVGESVMTTPYIPKSSPKNNDVVNNHSRASNTSYHVDDDDADAEL